MFETTPKVSLGLSNLLNESDESSKVSLNTPRVFGESSKSENESDDSDDSEPSSKVSLFGHSKMKEIEMMCKKGKFDLLVDILTFFTYKIPHPFLNKQPDIAFRCIKLGLKLKTQIDKTLLENVHDCFMNSLVYQNASLKKNVQIYCAEKQGSVLSNKTVLELGYPYLAERINPIAIVQNSEVKYEIVLDDVKSVEVLKIFQKGIYSPIRTIMYGAQIDNDTLFSLYHFAKLISHSQLLEDTHNALSRSIAEISKLDQLRTFINEGKKGVIPNIESRALISYLKNNKISFLFSGNNEIALDVDSAELLTKEGTLCTLLKTYVTGLYVKNRDDLEKLFVCVVLDESMRKNIKTLVFPGFEGDLNKFAKHFPNIENIIINGSDVSSKNAPTCFPNLIYCSRIPEGQTHSQYIAEIKHCKANFWTQPSSVEKLRESIPEGIYASLFSWRMYEDKYSAVGLLKDKPHPSSSFRPYY